jgi:hypothetical protein
MLYNTSPLAVEKTMTVTKDMAVLSSERTPHKNKTVTVKE